MRHDSTSIVPAARVENLIITESKDEVLVYDTAQHHIHHLNQTSAVVWRLCDGRRSVADLVREAQLKVDGTVNEDAVRLALAKLEDAELLEGALVSSLRGVGQSRRTLLKRAAVAGAVAVPAIVSMSAPAAAATGSGGDCGDPCGGVNSGCRPGGQPNCSQCGPLTGSGSGNFCCSPSGNPGRAFACAGT